MTSDHQPALLVSSPSSLDSRPALPYSARYKPHTQSLQRQRQRQREFKQRDHIELPYSALCTVQATHSKSTKTKRVHSIAGLPCLTLHDRSYTLNNVSHTSTYIELTYSARYKPHNQCLLQSFLLYTEKEIKGSYSGSSMFHKLSYAFCTKKETKGSYCVSSMSHILLSIAFFLERETKGSYCGRNCIF